MKILGCSQKLFTISTQGEMKFFLKLKIDIGSYNIITFKNKKCLNCGKEGHIKSNCPQINNQMKCTKCGEFGHFLGQHDLYCAVCDEQYYHNTEGQLISECLFDNLKFSKKTTKNLTNFCPRI